MSLYAIGTPSKLDRASPAARLASASFAPARAASEVVCRYAWSLGSTAAPRSMKAVVISTDETSLDPSMRASSRALVQWRSGIFDDPRHFEATVLGLRCVLQSLVLR